MYLRETGWEVVEWIHLVQDRDQWRALVNTVMSLRVTQQAGNIFLSIVTISFSRALLYEVRYINICLILQEDSIYYCYESSVLKHCLRIIWGQAVCPVKNS
jgi:hypothetical protein